MAKEFSLKNLLVALRMRTLRTKIIAWFFVPTAIILLAVALVTFVSYQQVTEDLVLERDQELVRLSASQLASELTLPTDFLTTLARRLHAYLYYPPALRLTLVRASNELTMFDGGVVRFIRS